MIKGKIKSKSKGEKFDIYQVRVAKNGDTSLPWKQWEPFSGEMFANAGWTAKLVTDHVRRCFARMLKRGAVFGIWAAVHYTVPGYSGGKKKNVQRRQWELVEVVSV